MSTNTDKELRERLRAAIGFRTPAVVRSLAIRDITLPADRFEPILDEIIYVIQRDRSRLRDELLAATPEKRTLYEPVTKKEIGPGESGMMDLNKDQRGTLVFVQDNGYNQAVDDIVAAITNVFSKEGE
jgi:hypothetical protein